MTKQYRIVTDAYLGYEVQYSYWWLPFWIEVSYPYCNTHSSIDEAKKFINDIKKIEVYREP